VKLKVVSDGGFVLIIVLVTCAVALHVLSYIIGVVPPPQSNLTTLIIKSSSLFLFWVKNLLY